MSLGTDLRGNPLGYFSRRLPTGHFLTRDEGLVVAHETVFAGMPTQSFSNATPVTLNNVVWTPIIAASATMSIDANGLKVTYPTSGEVFFMTPAGVFGTWLGKGVLRRKPWAIWCRLHSWTFASTAIGYVLGVGNNNYPEWSWGTFRARNTNGAPNNANGSFTAWGRFNSTEVNTAYSGASEVDGSSTAVQNDASDVACMFYRTPYMCDFYYGSWSATLGWPLFNDLKWGGSIPTLVDVRSAQLVDFRDPATSWRFYLISGAGGNSTSNNMTVDRFRVTYWND